MVTDKTVFTAHEIFKSFGNKQVLKGISVELIRGKFYGLVGENGSGKTTLLNILAGFRKADKGNIITSCSIGYCPQEIYLFPGLTVEENVNLFFLAYGLDRKPDRMQFQEYKKTLFEIFNLTGSEEKICSSLSEGTRHKLNLVVSLLHDPDLIFFDEPYSSFDWDTYLKFWDFSKQLKNRMKTVLIVSHLFYDKSMIDNVWELRNGILT